MESGYGNIAHGAWHLRQLLQSAQEQAFPGCKIGQIPVWTSWPGGRGAFSSSIAFLCAASEKISPAEAADKRAFFLLQKMRRISEFLPVAPMVCRLRRFSVAKCFLFSLAPHRGGFWLFRLFFFLRTRAAKGLCPAVQRPARMPCRRNAGSSLSAICAGFIKGSAGVGASFFSRASGRRQRAKHSPRPVGNGACVSPALRQPARLVARLPFDHSAGGALSGLCRGDAKSAAADRSAA